MRILFAVALLFFSSQCHAYVCRTLCDTAEFIKQAEELREQVEKYKAALENAQNHLQQILSEKDELGKRLRETTQSIEGITNENTRLNGVISDGIKSYENKITEQNTSINEFKKENQQLKEEQKKIKTELEQLSEKSNCLEDYIKRIQCMYDKNCDPKKLKQEEYCSQFLPAKK
jgi:uncharacterized coiled-coil DUF342 family protein